MIKQTLFILIQVAYIISASAQSNFDYNIELKNITFPNLPGLHSFVYAQKNDKWLLIGGRKDGLHARQPFNAFPLAENNTDIYVVDINTQQVWSSSINVLPTDLQEQLQSTNMNFYQDNDSLYIIGGYGYSVSNSDHITYPFLTSIYVSSLIDSIVNNKSIGANFKQIQDSAFAVTGGYLKKLGNIFYLVGGQKFDGRYNPMGNPTYTQTYTDQIRKFSINNSNTTLSFSNYATNTDPIHLHRRDYNLLPQIFPNHQEGFTISSGVFQPNINLPYLYPVNIDSAGITPITSFNQYLSNYHCANASLYDSFANNMHTLFFGGMSQYYYDGTNLINDSLVPFIKTVSRMSRDSGGNLHEFKMSTEMPEFNTSGSEFIYNLSLPHYSSKIIKLSNISADSILIGHIYGGILSQTQNPFSVNQTSTTSASNSLYEVWLKPSSINALNTIIPGVNPYKVMISPNPVHSNCVASFNTTKMVNVDYFIVSQDGKLLATKDLGKLEAKNHEIKIDLKDYSSQRLQIVFSFDNLFFTTNSIIKL